MILLAVSTFTAFMLSIMSIALGTRRTHAPECRKCKASLISYKKILTQCPSCSRPIATARDVYFRGRHRSKKLWIICTLTCLPFGFLVLIFTGVVFNVETIGKLTNIQGPPGAAIGIVDAMRMETDELIENLATRPAGPNGWGELNERFLTTPPSDEQITALSVSIQPGVEAHLTQSATSFRPNFELARSLATLTSALGFTDPTVQEIIQPLINVPNDCPEVFIKSRRLNIKLNTTPIARSDHNLLGFSGLKHASVTKAIRIDGEDVPIKNAKGVRNWSTISATHRLKLSELPESMTTPGEHSIELELTNTILPTDIANKTPFTLWPTFITKKSNTVTCTFEITEDSFTTLQP